MDKKQQIKEALAKHHAKTTKKTKAVNGETPKKSKTPRLTIDSATLEIIMRPGGATLQEVFDEISKKFSNRDKTVLLNTTKRRLHGHLQQTRGVTIIKDENGKYHGSMKT